MTNIDPGLIAKAKEWAKDRRQGRGTPLHLWDAAVEVIANLPDQIIDADKVRGVMEDMAYSLGQTINDDEDRGYDFATARWKSRLEALLPTPKPKTLADLIEEGHDPARYQWMQGNHRGEWCVIIRMLDHDSKLAVSLLTIRGATIWTSTDEVIPLPDLPRLVWPASEPEQDDETPTPESAPEPRFTPGGFIHSSLDNVNAHEPQAGETSVVEGLPEELQALLNRYSADSVSGTPDFILGDFLIGVIKEYNEAVSRRAEWRGEPIDLPALAHIKPEVAPKVLTTVRDYEQAAKGTVVFGDAVREKSSDGLWYMPGWEPGRTSKQMRDIPRKIIYMPEVQA